jgi:hypothetical protein
MSKAENKQANNAGRKKKYGSFQTTKRLVLYPIAYKKEFFADLKKLTSKYAKKCKDAEQIEVINPETVKP